MTGTVKSFNGEKGFGFITGQDGTDIFCHIIAVVDGSCPQTGDNVTFDVEESRSKPGQMTACNVRGGSGAPPVAQPGKGKDGKGKDKGWGKDSLGGGYGAAKGDGWGGG